MKLRDLQLKELEMLKEILKITGRHNLRCYMLGGTFLGAVRHRGFIPWDDDVDMGMPREDYEKFTEFAQRELEPPLKLVSFKTDETHHDFCNRVVNESISVIRNDAITEQKENIWIDIFPLDGMPDNPFVRHVHQLRLLFLRLLLQYSKFRTGVNIKKKRGFVENVLIKLGFIVSKICRFDTGKRLFAIENAMKKYPYEKSRYVVNFMGAYKFREMFPRSFYDDSVLYDFEDIQLPAPRVYDKVLSQLYGDYMTPPAQTERFSHSMKL